MNKMNHQRIFLFLTMVLWGLSLSAQEIDHVYLKNGSVIRGNIIEIEPVDHVKIQDLCGNIWYYRSADVIKITSEPFNQAPQKEKHDLTFRTGLVNMTSIGFLAGSSNNDQVAPFSLLMVNGYRNPLGLFSGAGIGIEFLRTNYMPLFADIRFDLFEGDVVPYAMIKGGYAFPLSSTDEEYDIKYDYSGGPMAGAGIGLKIKSRSHFAWDISLMYRYQKTSYSEVYDWNQQKYEYSDIYNRMELRIGFYID